MESVLLLPLREKEFCHVLFPWLDTLERMRCCVISMFLWGHLECVEYFWRFSCVSPEESPIV